MDQEHFYQLPQPINNYPYLQWIVDSRLRRYVQRRIPEHFSPSEVLEIAKLLVSEVCQLAPLDLGNPAPIAKEEGDLRGCITAFLAHILFRHPKMGRRMEIQIRTNIFESLQRHGQSGEIVDTYQTILRLLFDPSKLLKKFNPILDWYDSLSRHIHLKFKTWLIDELRRLLKDQKFGRTNLGLLNRYSIDESLCFAGEQGDRLSGLLLLHACFRELVAEKQFATNNPTFAQYDALLARYQERDNGMKFEIKDREQLIKLLEYLGNTYRNYEQPKVSSSNVPSDDGKIVVLGETQEDDREKDRRENWGDNTEARNAEVRNLAIDLLHRLSIDRQLLLLVVYGLKLKQKEARIEVNLRQDAISKKLSTLLANLAKELYAINPHSLPQQALTAKIIEEYVAYVKSICEVYYPKLLTNISIEIFESAPTDSNIEHLFIDRLEKQWQFTFKPDGAGWRKAAEFVQRRTNKP